MWLWESCKTIAYTSTVKYIHNSYNASIHMNTCIRTFQCLHQIKSIVQVAKLFGHSGHINMFLFSQYTILVSSTFKLTIWSKTLCKTMIVGYMKLLLNYVHECSLISFCSFWKSLKIKFLRKQGKDKIFNSLLFRTPQS